MSRISVVIAALLGALLAIIPAGCGARNKRGDAHARAQLNALFPTEDIPLARSRLLEVLPAETLAVVLAPNLRDVAGSLLAADGAPVGESDADESGRASVRALTQLSEDVLGYDVFDLAAMEEFGVATDRPIALAVLDLETGAAVLPLRDRKRFDKQWSEGPETYRASHERHAVIAFPLGNSFDPTSDIIRGLRVVARELSLARHPGLGTALKQLRHGDDLLMLVNPAALRRVAAAVIDEERSYHDLQTSREMVELSDPDDGDAQREAKDELLAAERAVERLDTWQALLDGGLGPLGGMAVGIGIDPTGIKVQAALALRESPAGNDTAHDPTAPLPEEVRAVAPGRVDLATRVPARLIGPLVGMVAGARVQQKLSDLVAALGGHNALTGTISVALRTHGRVAYERDDAVRRSALVRVGVRSPTEAARLLRGQRKLPGWQLRVNGRMLVLEQSPPGRRVASRRRARRDRGEVYALARSPSMARLFIDVRTAFDAFASPSHASSADILSEQLSAAANREQRNRHARLVERRRRLLDQHRGRLGALRSALADALGAASAVVQRRGDTVYVHGWQAFADPDAPPTAARMARVWYEHSGYSPYGQKLAELDGDLARIHARLDMNSLTDLLEDGQATDTGLLDSIGTTGGSGLSGITGGGPSLSAGATSSLNHSSGGIGIGRVGSGGRTSSFAGLDRGRVLAVTASVTHRDAGIEHAVTRAVLDQTLLSAVPNLRRCYRAQRASVLLAAGYLIAELSLRERVITRADIRVPDSGAKLNRPEFLACVRNALERPLVAADRGRRQTPAGAQRSVSGTVTATLWFGVLPRRKSSRKGLIDL